MRWILPWLALGIAAAAESGKKPNILFILCDDLGYGDVGVFHQNERAAEGKPAIRTPQLDKMAAGGMQLRGLYAPAPVCAPSRASFFSGVSQGHCGVRNNQFDKALDDNHTVGTVLREAGYATALIGKYGLQGLDPKESKTKKTREKSIPAWWTAYPTKRGFDYFFGYVRHRDGHDHYPKEGFYGAPKEVWENDQEVSADLDKCYTTDLFTAKAKQWITDTSKSGKPFFLTLAYDTPHAILQLPTGPYPAGGGLTGGLQWTGKPHEMITSATGTPDSFTDPLYAQKDWPDVYKRYATSVTRIDHCVGDLLKLLADLRIDRDTLVIFTTDNGPSQESYLKEEFSPEFFRGYGPFDGIKRDLWEGGIRVGGLAVWPGRVPPGKTEEAPAQFQDFLPTFAEIAGVPIPARADGESLVSLLKGKPAKRSRPVYSEYQVSGTTPRYEDFKPSRKGAKHGEMQFIRLGDHVGVRYDIQSHADPFEIYDITKDPGQRDNLASKLPDLQKTMHDSVLRLRLPDRASPRPYDSELVPALDKVTGTPGLRAAYPEGKFAWLPRIGNTGATATVASPEKISSGKPAVLTGTLRAPVDGEYQFRVKEEKSFLRIHQAAVIDSDFHHKPVGTIRLQAGHHPITLTLFSPATLEWQKPGDTNFSPIPAGMFSH